MYTCTSMNTRKIGFCTGASFLVSAWHIYSRIAYMHTFTLIRTCMFIYSIYLNVFICILVFMYIRFFNLCVLSPYLYICVYVYTNSDLYSCIYVYIWQGRVPHTTAGEVQIGKIIQYKTRCMASSFVCVETQQYESTAR